MQTEIGAQFGFDAPAFLFSGTLCRGGDLGFGAIIAASGVGLVLGSFLAPVALGKVGLRRHYVGSIALMAVGWGGAALSGTIWVADGTCSVLVRTEGVDAPAE